MGSPGDLRLDRQVEPLEGEPGDPGPVLTCTSCWTRFEGDIDIIRKGVELVLQALVVAEATERIGAGRFERTLTRTIQRKGDGSFGTA